MPKRKLEETIDLEEDNIYQSVLKKKKIVTGLVEQQLKIIY